MIDDFLKKHEVSIWIYVVGVAVIFFLMIGGAIASSLFTFSIGYFLAVLNPKSQIMLTLMMGVISALFLVVSNVLIIRGYGKAFKLNHYNVYLQLLFFLVGVFFFVGDGKWLFISFAVCPLIAYKLMFTDKYKSFVAFYEVIKQDPEGYRKWALDRLSE